MSDATSPLPEFDRNRLNFEALTPIVDLIYSAVIGYAILLIGEEMKVLFEPGKTLASVAWLKVALVSFVFLFSLSDAVETRMMTHCVPYRGRARFTVDLAIALAFFLAFAGAAKQSSNFLLPFSVIFFLGCAWGWYLHNDCRERFRWSYPKAIVLSHVAAGCIWLAYWWSLRSAGIETLGWPETGKLILYYSLWLFIATLGKELYRVPAIEADLFPTSLIDVAVRKVIGFFREN